MSFTDFLRLSEHKLFECVRESLPLNISKTLNLLTIKDGVLFSWDFKNSCVLSLNVAAFRSRDGDNVTHQNLLPLNHPLFTPELLIANDSLSLLAIAGSSGVLVLELPLRYPPYGGFDRNKGVVVCRSHCLDERLFLCSDTVTIEQVKFHPGSLHDNHIVVLSSDNLIRFYKIENSEAVTIGVYQIGRKPRGFLPGGGKGYLNLLGDTAVDFDFGQPEVEEDPFEEKSIIERPTDDQKWSLSLRPSSADSKVKPIYLDEKIKKDRNKNKTNNLVWPIYILRGDGSIFIFTIALFKRSEPKLRGPLPVKSKSLNSFPETCSIICLNSNPPVLCVGQTNGRIQHLIVLPVDEAVLESPRIVEEEEETFALLEAPNRELYVFEMVELQANVESTTESKKKFDQRCFLFKDESKANKYYVTHKSGVNAVEVLAIEGLQMYASTDEEIGIVEDIFSQMSKTEYVLCTKVSTSDKANLVIGFSPYYSPPSTVTLLADGSIVTMSVLNTSVIPKPSDNGNDGSITDLPTKKATNEPFEHYIQKILRVSNQPILKLSTETNSTQKDCYELLQRASLVFRDMYFTNQLKAKDEIEKKVKALQMLKNYQLNELNRMNYEKQTLQEKAENLAEKYEDIKDKQDELLKRCERLLILVSQKRAEPSDAEIEFLKELKESQIQVEDFEKAVDKLKLKIGYQKTKMEHWKAQEIKKHPYISEIQEKTIRQNLEDMTRKMAELYKQVLDYKEQLNIN